jgi:hypothetical protein
MRRAKGICAEAAGRMRAERPGRAQGQQQISTAPCPLLLPVRCALSALVAFVRGCEHRALTLPRCWCAARPRYLCAPLCLSACAAWASVSTCRSPLLPPTCPSPTNLYSLTCAEKCRGQETLDGVYSCACLLSPPFPLSLSPSLTFFAVLAAGARGAAEVARAGRLAFVVAVLACAQAEAGTGVGDRAWRVWRA